MTDLGEARCLMHGAVAWMRTQGLTFSRVTLPLSLRTVREFSPGFWPFRRTSTLLGQTSVVRWGIGGRWSRASIQDIAIRHGLPRHVFEATCVHELGHAWLADQQIFGLDRVSEEGFCQLLEHRWLARLPAADMQQLREAVEQCTDAVYGAGFQRMRSRAAKLGGFSQLVDDLRRRHGR